MRRRRSGVACATACGATSALAAEPSLAALQATVERVVENRARRARRHLAHSLREQRALVRERPDGLPAGDVSFVAIDDHRLDRQAAQQADDARAEERAAAREHATLRIANR